jgi:protein-S-isoprenylcysteine O-methyltransferase Ste14
VPAWIAARTGASLPAGASPRWLALPLGLAGAAVVARCMADFVRAGRGTPAPVDPPKALVVCGLYRWTRNPMYVGVTSVLLAEAWLLASPALAAYAASVALGFHAFVVLHEEPFLQRRFGEDYTAYCRAVPRWIPRKGGGACGVVDG